jgi:hypothetical protein
MERDLLLLGNLYGNVRRSEYVDAKLRQVWTGTATVCYHSAQ